MEWSLEQIRVFVSVAEQRSFSAVARESRRAQSAVSSAVALLEADLGVSLFDRSSGRQPRLTEAGSALLEEARELLRQCDRLDGRAMALMPGKVKRSVRTRSPVFVAADSATRTALWEPGVIITFSGSGR